MGRQGVLSLLLAAVVLAGCCVAYNDDEPIYKWSPLWFNRYFRTANMYKRAGAITSTDRLSCVPENRRCGYRGLEMPCCDLARCIMDHCIPIGSVYDDQ